MTSIVDLPSRIAYNAASFGCHGSEFQYETIHHRSWIAWQRTHQFHLATGRAKRHNVPEAVCLDRVCRHEWDPDSQRGAIAARGSQARDHDREGDEGYPKMGGMGCCRYSKLTRRETARSHEPSASGGTSSHLWQVPRCP